MAKQMMRAVRLFAPGDVRCVEVEKPEIEESDDIIIKVKACGVCGSDIERVMEKGAHEMPLTIGHEFAGEVQEVGTGVKKFQPGDRVTIMPLIPCGECDYCKIGEYVLCEDYSYYGSRIDGAMAEYIRVKANNTLKLPLDVNYEMGAMTDPISVALHAVRKLDKIEAGQTAAVFGMGPIGFATMQWLKALGCGEVYAIDIFEEKLDLAKRLGADLCINGKSQDAVETIMAETGGEGVDIAIEFAGTD
ncbi:MAG: alcohol dehydrogenase catalytic domain-containing protein, partial [Halanaerobiales bacterium]